MFLISNSASGTINVPVFLRLEGILDETALEKAVNQIIYRHDALRTCFIEQNGELTPSIEPSLSINIVKVDLDTTHADGTESAIQSLLKSEAITPFDLKKGPLLRAKLIRVGNEYSLFLLTFHQIIFNGGSKEIFFRELSALYNAFCQGQASPLPDLPTQLASANLSQREWQQSQHYQTVLDYWQQRLAYLPTLELPTDRSRPQARSFRAKSHQFNLSTDLSEKLNTLSQHEGVTLFLTLLAAFQVLLHRYTGQDDIVIGTPSSERSHLAFENVTGFVTNTMVLRTNLAENPRFIDLLTQIKENSLEDNKHKAMPFENLVNALNLEPDLTRHPLFQVTFELQDTSQDSLSLNELTVTPLIVDSETTPFDLALTIFRTYDELTGFIEYASDLYEPATIARLIGHFQTLLEGIVNRPDTRLSALPLLPEYERRQLLEEWNDTKTAFPEDQCIHELFEAQVTATPQAVAVINGNSQLTYAELNEQANQLAHYLIELGVKPDMLVAICLERGLMMVVGLMAILKAGAAYVPLDPGYPKERLTFMLEDSAPVALMTQSQLVDLFGEMKIKLPLIDLENKSAPWAGQPNNNPDCRRFGLTSRSLACVFYTSGSTGKPKGVMVEHKCVTNIITDMKDRYHIRSEDRILQFATVAFDMSVQDFFGTLLTGSALVLRNDQWIAGPEQFWQLCEKFNISIVNLPTLFWQQLAQDDFAIPTSVRQIIIGGEAVSSKTLLHWFERPGHRPLLSNEYGPTETTVTATAHEPSMNSLSWQSIGRPIANTLIYILDATMQPTPIGVSGELYIGGAGVARGYLNRPDLTEERFVADPFVSNGDARLYKTGDLARWLTDGTIEYLGRNDFQVKIRGFRIELGDIESLLLEYPGLREGVVDVFEPVPEEKLLVAYLVADTDPVPDTLELRDYLLTKLPYYMVPSAFVYLDAMPVTPNGKLDRKALPKPDHGWQLANPDYIEPRNPVEHRLAEIWAEILNIRPIGVHDNFFALGGYSLLAIKVIVEINSQFNTDLPLGTIYQFQTIAELADTALSNNYKSSQYYSILPIQKNGSRPPLFAIHTLSLRDIHSLSLGDLPSYFGDEQPLYFIRYGMAGEVRTNPVRLPKLEDLASHYISEMQKIQPEGPYHLFGFSFGGLIAYEMSIQLVAAGYDVAFLGLLDTHLSYKSKIQPFRRIIQKLLCLHPSKLFAMIKSQFTDLTDPLNYNTDFWPHVYTDAPDIACFNKYQIKPYSGKVTLFQAEVEESMFFIAIPPESDWKKLLGDKLETEYLCGSHLEILLGSNAEVTAKKIMSYMDRHS